MTLLNNTYYLKLDIKEQQPNPVIRVVQFDTVYFNIELYDAGKKMDLSLGDRFTVSVEHEETGERTTGIAEYDGVQFVVYNLKYSQMKRAGKYIARFASYDGRLRVSSLAFRFEVYEDLEYVPHEEDDITFLQEIFAEIEQYGKVAQRQGEYAEDRGDYANAAGDYANESAKTNMLNWLPYVKTTVERNSSYPNPNNGDIVYVVNENKIFRFDGIDAMDWEVVAGWDTSVIQDIYNVKEDKTVVKSITDAIKADLASLTIGGRNILSGTEFKSTITPKFVTDKFTLNTDTTLGKLTITPTGTYTSGSSYVLPLVKAVESGTYVNVSFYAKPLADGGQFKFKIGNGTNTGVIDLGSPSSNYKKYTASITSNHTDAGDVIYLENTKGIEIRKDSLKVEQGNRPTAWTPSYEDVYSRIQTVQNSLNELKDTVNNHGNRISSLELEMNTNVVKKSVFEQNLAAQTEKLTQITQTADGIMSEVSKKIGSVEVKSMINQSAEAIRIKASNIDFDGAVVFKNNNNVLDPNAFVSINNGEIVAKGYYERVWRDGIKRNRIQQIQLKDGMMRITDPKGDLIDKDSSNSYNYWNDQETKLARSLYYTSDGISTYRDGTGKYTTGDGSGTGHYVASGTIEFWSHEYSKVRGLTMMSASGAVSLHANANAVHIHAGSHVYNRSKKGNIVFAPQEDIRNGENVFTMSVNSVLDGRLMYGDLTKNQGSGLRFSKSSKTPVITGIDGNGYATAAVTLNIGKIEVDNIASRNGKDTVYWNGKGDGNLASKTALQAGGIKTIGTNFYVGVGGELRVTNRNGYNHGKSIGYLPVRASKFIPVSSRKYKENIKDVQLDTVSILKETDIKQYNLKTDLEVGKEITKYGVILEDTHKALHDGDGIDLYTMVSLLWDVTKKQQAEIEELKEMVKKQN